MKNMSSSTSTPNNFGCHSSHLTVKDNYRKGPLLYDNSVKENMIFIENQHQSIKSPTLFKSEVCIFSPGSNQNQMQSHSLIQKINSLHQESYFESPDQKQKREEQFKLMNEFQEIPQQIDSFIHLIENQNSQQQEQQEVHHQPFLDNFYRQSIVIIYFQNILTFICLPYATATNSLVIYYCLLSLRIIDITIQIKCQYINEKSKLWLPKRQLLYSAYFEIGQIAGIFCLIFLANNFIIKFLLTMLVLACSFPKIQAQELSIKLEFDLKDEQFQILIPISRLCIYIHILTCLWFSLNNDSGANHNYGNSLVAILGVISFNNQTIVTQEHQKIFFALVSMSSLFMLAYIIHQTKGLLGPLKQDLSQFQQAFSKVPVSLKLQIIKYCNDHANKSDKNKKLNLPSSIGNKITYHQGYKMLKSCFSQYEESTLMKCLDLCEEIEAQTEQRLLKEGQVDDCSIYFIMQGKVKIVDRHCREVFARKETGQYFGEYAFYTQNPRAATILSDGSCKLLKLRRVDFLSCLSWKDKVVDDPNEQQIFQLDLEQMIFSENYKWKCYCCNSNRHIINNCPFLMYRPYRQKLLTKYIKESVNKRLNIRRGRIAKHDSAWMIKEQLKAYENKMQYLQNDFFTPTSCLTSNCQLPYYDEYQRESIINQSQSDVQIFNQQFEKQNNEIDKVSRNDKNDNSQQTQITAGFGNQFPSKFLVESKMEIINEIESLEEIDQKENKQEKSLAYSQMSNSPDCVEAWAKQRGSLKNQKYMTTIRTLKSKSSKKQSTSNKSNFTPFNATEYFNEDNFDQMYNFQFYRPESNLEQILQRLFNQQ